MKAEFRRKNRCLGIVLITITILLTLAQVVSATPPIPATDVKSQIGTVAPYMCPDPSVKLIVNKVLAANTAKITLTGTVCNIGLKDYSGTVPMDAFFMVITWHPPKTAAMESNLQIFSHNPVGNPLKKGECKTFTQVYTIPGVAKWADASTPNTKGLAVKEFTFGVDKKYPMQAGDTSFSKAENCKIENDRASSTVYYVESSTAIPVTPGGLPTKGIAPKEAHPDWLNPQPEPPLPR
ncbi:MAG: hypothetical protein MUF26_01010 [Syntrophales bacterium]|jgi:hypothetical protein|nr:hypothetical protein [Syntrophales bacterium]